MRTMFIRRNDKEWLEDLVMRREGELVFDPAEDDETEYEFLLAELKTATILEDWTQEIEEDKILEKLGIGPGDLRNKVEIGGWLLYSMREMSNIFNKDAYPPLTELMTRLNYGVKAELLDLVKLKGVAGSGPFHCSGEGSRRSRRCASPDGADITGHRHRRRAGDQHQEAGGAPTRAPLAPIGEETQEEPGTQKRGKDRGQSSLLDF